MECSHYMKNFDVGHVPIRLGFFLLLLFSILCYSCHPLWVQIWWDRVPSLVNNAFKGFKGYCWECSCYEMCSETSTWAQIVNLEKHRTILTYLKMEKTWSSGILVLIIIRIPRWCIGLYKMYRQKKKSLLWFCAIIFVLVLSPEYTELFRSLVFFG